MQTRRSVVVSLAGAVVLGGGALAEDAPAGNPPAGDGLPKVNVLPGKPPVLDYGEGVKVPCDKGAFLTLWEGEHFWITFGFGTSPRPERAMAEAIHHAEGAMKYLLLTLAFAPDRLQKVDGSGWRQKVEDPQNYVIGDIEVPGKTSRPMTDAYKGYGNAEQNLGGAPAASGGGIGPGTMAGTVDFGAGMGFNPAMMLTKVNAFCAYTVLKKDLSLDDVHKRAQRVVL